VGGWDQNGPYGDWLGGVKWIHLAQDRGWWRAVVNVVMNLRVLAPRSWLVNDMNIGEGEISWETSLVRRRNR
jgi:hypothetical protein